MLPPLTSPCDTHRTKLLSLSQAARRAPIGLLAIGRVGDDKRTLGAANWLASRLAGIAQTGEIRRQRNRPDLGPGLGEDRRCFL